MSTATGSEITYAKTETPDRAFLVREFPTEVVAGDGRTVDVRIVPYDEVATVADNGGPLYREQWVSGAFDDQLVAGYRLKVFMNFEHHQGIANMIGKGVSLRSEADGLHGTFRVFENSQGDTALELLNDGILDAVSLEAVPKKSVRAQGVVQRVKAHLRGIALCRQGAFQGAQVLAVREEVIESVELDDELRAKDIDPELLDRCRALGITLPQRYQAHPVTDTSAESDTSADDTRLFESMSSSEEDV